MSKNETQVSGAIFAIKDSTVPEGERYAIMQSKNSSSQWVQGWGLPVETVEPNDLRALADRIENKRQNSK